MTTWRFERAEVVTPGKYGADDYRASLSGIAPRLGEYALLLGGKLLAEDRYAGPYRQGRDLYLGHLRQVAQATDMDGVLQVAERTHTDDGRSGLPGFVRCCRGGKNDCVSLCYDCFSAGFQLPVAVVRSNLEWWGFAAEDIEEYVRKVRRR